MEKLDLAIIEDSLPPGLGTTGGNISKRVKCSSTSPPQREDTFYREIYI